MNISIITLGSRGDVQPYLALGLGLKEQGFNVKLLANENFKEFISDFNIDFHPIRGNVHELVNSEAGKDLLESGYSIKFIKKFTNIMSEYFDNFFDDMLEGTKGTDFIIFSPLCFVAQQVAEYLGVKSMTANLQPFNRTNELPSFMFPETFSFIPKYNLMTHLVFEQAVWQSVRHTVNKNIVKKLNRPKIGFWGRRNELEKLKFPMIYGFSKYIIKRPNDWNKNHKITGYWFLDTQKNFKPEKELLKFLDTDKKIIYAGFGSMVNRNPEETSNMIIKSIKGLNVKLIIMTGWGGLSISDNYEDIHVVNQIPHDWIFPKINAVIHHCGAGTTSATLRAGIPSISVPFFGDQPFWSNQIYKLGLSTKPINRKDLNSSNLREAIIESIANDNLINRAKIISKKINSENGISNAVETIKQII
ncbi:MAG: glycosyltransferase [Candidatus Sericytochromatia bacterium]